MLFAYYYSLLLVPCMFYPVAIKHDWRMARIRLKEQFLKLITKFKSKQPWKILTWKEFSQKLLLCCFTSRWFTKLLAASKEEDNNRLKRWEKSQLGLESHHVEMIRRQARDCKRDFLTIPIKHTDILFRWEFWREIELKRNQICKLRKSWWTKMKAKHWTLQLNGEYRLRFELWTLSSELKQTKWL